MSPIEEYISIIHNRQQNPLSKTEYGEVHHIIPKSCGGPDVSWNKVRLLPEEHYNAHYLLTFIYATGDEHESMVYAWNWLSNRIGGNVVSAEEYGRLKRESAKIHSKRMKGVGKGQKHGPMPKETRERISNTAKQVVHTPEWNANVARAKKGQGVGRKATAETRKKLSESLMGRPGYWKGKTWTQEQKQKLYGRTPYNKGTHHSGMSGKKHSPETIERMRKAAKEREARKKAAG